MNALAVPNAGEEYSPGDGEATSDTPEEKQPRFDLAQLTDTINIAEQLPDEELNTIGATAHREYEIDLESRKPWLEIIERATKLAMQVKEAKSFPWPNASNVKYPLLTEAAIQFNARAYPAIIQGQSIVKAKIVGNDDGVPLMGPDGQPVMGQDGQPQFKVPPGAKRSRGDRVARHMSWQLAEQMEEWEEDTDRLLVMLPIAGCMFRKSYYDPVLGRNCSTLILPKYFVVNASAKSLETVPRQTHEFDLYPDMIQERMRSGWWKQQDLGLPQGADANDSQAAHWFLEQHRRIDLDQDGYAEPYIVTLHRDTKKVMRIVARWQPDGILKDQGGKIVCVKAHQYFTKYPFIPSPDGSFYDVGFGMLLDPINESVNTVLNQLVDAGTLSNAGGGWLGKGVRMGSKKYYTSPGSWTPVEVQGGVLKDNIVPYPVREPSPVLFQLLGLLVEAGKTISAVKDVLSGDTPTANVPATTVLAIIEQGMKVFSAIFKRIHRALKSEVGKLYELNRLYLPDESYFNVLDTEEAIGRQDYENKSYDIVPVTDPTIVTDMQRMAKATFLMEFREDPALDQQEITRRVFEAAQIDEIDDLFSKGPSPPSPEALAMLAEIETKNKDTQIKAIKAIAEIEVMRTQAIKNLADAEAAELGTQLDTYLAQLEAIRLRAEQAAGNGEANGSNGRGMGRMAKPAGNASLPQIPSGLPPNGDGGLGGGQPPIGPMGMGADVLGSA